jgi:hypothetical protein
MIDGVQLLGALILFGGATLVPHLPAALALHLPLALDGEAATEAGGNGKAIAIVSAVSIVFGYVVLAALWHFVFREKARQKRKK